MNPAPGAARVSGPGTRPDETLSDGKPGLYGRGSRQDRRRVLGPRQADAKRETNANREQAKAVIGLTYSAANQSQYLVACATDTSMSSSRR